MSAFLDLPRNAGGSRTETIGLRADLADGRAEFPTYICCKSTTFFVIASF